MSQRNMPTVETLNGTSSKALSFLTGVAARRDIRYLLLDVGYTHVHHQRGVDLLREVTRLSPFGPGHQRIEPEVNAAIHTVDSLDEATLRRIGAALHWNHPEQSDFVTADLNPERGYASVLVMATLLDRLDALESGQGRPPGAREADRAALATLAERGYTTQERNRLRVLVTEAQHYIAIEEPFDTNEEAFQAQRNQALFELYKWYNEWSRAARAVVKRRSQLRTLGLARRRKPQKTNPEEVEPVVP